VKTKNNRGAPKGNQNAVKHGRYTREMKEFLRIERQFIQSVQKTRGHIELVIKDEKEHN